MNIFFTNHTTILKMLIRFQEMSAMDFVLKNVKVLNLYYFVPLREKCPSTELFLVHIFLYSDWIRRFTPKISVFSSNTGKYGPEITPYLDPFHAMLILKLLQRISLNFRWYWDEKLCNYSQQRLVLSYCYRALHLIRLQELWICLNRFVILYITE